MARPSGAHREVHAEQRAHCWVRDPVVGTVRVVGAPGAMSVLAPGWPGPLPARTLDLLEARRLPVGSRSTIAVEPVPLGGSHREDGARCRSTDVGRGAQTTRVRGGVPPDPAPPARLSPQQHRL